MFTVAQIEKAHEKVKSGADFPDYIQEIKKMGVVAFETWVKDSHTRYYGADDFQVYSASQYEELKISEHTDKPTFLRQLKAHQKGQTDYLSFCKDCANAGIEKWVVDLKQTTCIYYDKAGNEVLMEKIPE